MKKKLIGKTIQNIRTLYYGDLIHIAFTDNTYCMFCYGEWYNHKSLDIRLIGFSHLSKQELKKEIEDYDN